MPELPEVETVRRTLEPCCQGEKIVELHLLHPDVLLGGSLAEVKKAILGKKILGISRQGKYLIVNLEENLHLVLHLRMTGRFVLAEAEDPIVKHTHVIFKLSNGKELRFIDIRRFGRVELVRTENLTQVSGLRTLGPEPLSEEFNLEYFKAGLKKANRNIKALILDQTFIAGLGNIYADEALFQAKINPSRLAKDIKETEAAHLHNAIKSVIAKAIEARGTTFRDYVDGRGEKGSFQNLLKAYGKGGTPCVDCGVILEKSRVAGRGTVFCPHCQE